MSTGNPDLFVVCKQCGSEVSPYITECPYCGNRLRRRAPKLPRSHIPGRATRSRTRLRSLLAVGQLRRTRPPRERATGYESSRWAATRPYATAAIVAASCGLWIAWHAHPSVLAKMFIVGPIHGDWWRLLTYELSYLNRVYAFVTLLAIAIFGWLLERRHGPFVVLALFFGAGVSGALVALAVYPVPVLTGGNGPALALLAAWAAPDLQSAREGSYYDGDLLGTAAIAALLLAMPFAVGGVSWLAGVTGGVLGLVVGMGLHRLQQ